MKTTAYHLEGNHSIICKSLFHGMDIRSVTYFATTVTYYTDVVM